MELVPQLVPQLGVALWSLKGMYDQHGGNKNEIKRLLVFIREYEERIPDLVSLFKELGGVSGTSIDDLKKLETVIIEATKRLKEWSANKSFFRVFNSAERMQELEHLQTKVMASVQKALGLVNMAILVHLVAGHNKLLAGQKKILEMEKEARPQDQASSSTMNQGSEGYVWKDCQEPSPILSILKSIQHHVLNEDHQLVAAEHGVVYVISKDPSTAHTKVWMHTGQNDFISSNYSKPFRSTSRPFTSSTNKLYLGGKLLPGGRSTVLVWKAEQFFCALESPRAGGSTVWEYTLFTQSSTGSVLYCGCSDGTIEVWNRVHPNQPRVYSCQLTGHIGGISGLAVGKDGTLISVDLKHRNIVRVWCKLKQVAILNLQHEEVRRMACTFERNLYIATEGGSKMWCDLKNIVDHATLGGPGMVGPSLFGVDIFSPLQHPNSGPASANAARSCLVAHGASETVYFLCTTAYQKTYCIEEWRGNEFVSRVDTGLKTFQSWTVSRNGTVYCSSRSTGEICGWKLIKPTPGKVV